MKIFLKTLKWFCEQFVAQKKQRVVCDWIQGSYKIPLCGCCPACIEMGYAHGLIGGRREDLLAKYYSFSEPKGFMIIGPPKTGKPSGKNLFIIKH